MRLCIKQPAPLGLGPPSHHLLLPGARRGQVCRVACRQRPLTALSRRDKRAHAPGAPAKGPRDRLVGTGLARAAAAGRGLSHSRPFVSPAKGVSRRREAARPAAARQSQLHRTAAADCRTQQAHCLLSVQPAQQSQAAAGRRPVTFLALGCAAGGKGVEQPGTAKPILIIMQPWTGLSGHRRPMGRAGPDSNVYVQV